MRFSDLEVPTIARLYRLYRLLGHLGRCLGCNRTAASKLSAPATPMTVALGAISDASLPLLLKGFVVPVVRQNSRVTEIQNGAECFDKRFAPLVCPALPLRRKTGE